MSIYFMILLAYEFNIVVDQGVCLVGHGMSLVDAINDFPKNIIYQGV